MRLPETTAGLSVVRLGEETRVLATASKICYGEFMWARA
jgi:hypothetical protein